MFKDYCVVAKAITLFLFLYLQSAFVLSHNSPLLQTIYQCQQIKQSEERLRCFDQSLEKSNKQVVIETKDVVSRTVQNQAVHSSEELVRESEDKKNSLGSNYLVDHALDKKASKIGFILIGARQDRYKRWIYTFKNGQVWRQTEAKYMSKIKDFPVNVMLATGSMGSFEMQIEDRSKKIKVRRLK